MKKSKKFKYQLILLFLLSFGISNAQEFFNYNNVASNSSNGAVLKEKIQAVLNSNSVSFTSNNAARNRTSNAQVQASNNVNTLDLNYSQLNQVNAADYQNIKNCIVKVTSVVSAIDLNALNQFENLEIIHIIIETPSLTGDIRQLITMNNTTVLISYQISIPQ